MGTYINKGNNDFAECKSYKYVDKTGLIALVNKAINTEDRYICITRSRRFGKSMAANMLCAYYDDSCASKELFSDLYIATPDKPDDKEFPNGKHYFEYLNKFPVIYLDITDFTSTHKNDPGIVKTIQHEIKKELVAVYNLACSEDADDLMTTLIKINSITHKKFVMIIDEWDAILREFNNKDITDEYIDLYRRLFKGSNSNKVFACVYATGILPIKKYKTESALNNFREYSVIQPRGAAKYFGFCKDEVKLLCDKYHMDFAEMERWYDGYKIGKESSIFNPYSVMEAIANDEYRTYWTSTGTYDNLLTYIQMNFDGLKDDIIYILGGGRCRVNPTKFQNDMSEVRCKDDVLTVLIHLGYLAYDSSEEKCYIPNKEVADEFTNAVEDTSWSKIAKTIELSETLLDATINGDEKFVASSIDLAHDENTSILSYNNENSLACVLSIAFIASKRYYVVHREYSSSKGFADLVLIPLKGSNKPAIVIELKYNRSSKTAISQIKKNNYPSNITEYTGGILLVAINYSKKTKKHTCKIERIKK